HTKKNMPLYIRKGIIALLFSAICSLVYAQHTGCTLTVNGRVTDSDTGLPLSGVTVQVNPGELQAISDAHGYFHFSHLCSGTSYQVTASSVGFESAAMQLTPQSDTRLNIALQHGTIKLHDVEV